MSSASRTIAHIEFRYLVEEEDPITGRVRRFKRCARRGDTVELCEADIARGEKLGAFASEGDDEVVEDGFEEVVLQELNDIELLEWFQDSKPKVSEVVEAAEDSPEFAARLLKAEDAATGGDPRKGVVAGLKDIIGSSEEEGE